MSKKVDNRMKGMSDNTFENVNVQFDCMKQKFQPKLYGGLTFGQNVYMILVYVAGTLSWLMYALFASVAMTSVPQKYVGQMSSGAIIGGCAIAVIITIITLGLENKIRECNSLKGWH